VRAVLDANVLISAALSSQGPSAELIRRCRDGALDVIVSNLLLEELERACTYPRLRKRISAERAVAYIAWLREHATLAADPETTTPISSSDPGDDYLLALAIAEQAFLVTGDQHLLALGARSPIHPPAAFLRQLDHIT
jgi:putative PIN family toxin of toxin-antitoxin system